MESFESQDPTVSRKKEDPHCLRSKEKFPQSEMLCRCIPSVNIGALCFIRSKISTGHFILSSADQHYGDADSILSPVHTAKSTSSWFKGQVIPVLKCTTVFKASLFSLSLSELNYSTKNSDYKHS